MKKMLQKFKSIYWMLREIFWRSFVGFLILVYGVIQLWQTFVPMLPSEWGLKKINIQWYFWTIMLLIILMFYIIAQTYRLSAHRFELSLGLQFGTKPPRESYGRYVGVKIFNISPQTIEACIVNLIDVKPVDTEWEPSPLILRHDSLRWSDWMSPTSYESTFGKLDIKGGHEAIVNILYTQPKSTVRNVARVDLQTKDYSIDMPKGTYEIQLEILGVYSGSSFRLPIWLEFEYKGGTSIDELRPVNINRIDRRIDTISVEQDGVIKKYK